MKFGEERFRPCHFDERFLREEISILKNGISQSLRSLEMTLSWVNKCYENFDVEYLAGMRPVARAVGDYF